MSKYKKVFLQMMFGSPLDQEWLDKYFDNCAALEPYGWYWKIFTPNKIEGRSNVEIVPMTLEEFDQRVEKVTGINPHNYIDGYGPHKLTSDYYPLYGPIMEDHIKGFDFWGHTNWDVVYGRLDHYLTDDYLKDCDIFADESWEINGPFTIYRNTDKVNNLWRELPDWKRWFSEHELFYVDETHFSKVVTQASQEGRINFKHTGTYPWHSYDRLPQHQPKVSLEFQPDNSLYELFRDIVTGRNMGREIFFFHFSYTKKYPEIAIREKASKWR